MENKGYEPTDLNVRAIALFGVALAVSTGLVMLALAGWMRHPSRRTPEPMPPATQLERFSEPRLQVAPQEDLKALRARDEAALTSYGWIDREKGLVRIPVERSMDLVAGRGLPVRAERTPAKTTLDLIKERAVREETR